MSLLDMRLKLCASHNTMFQNMVERDDLLNEERTQDKLIQCLWYITRKWCVMFTAVQSDHRNDSDLGIHCHYNGYCADLWPLWIGPARWDYIPASHSDFQKFLNYAKNAPFIHEIGLAGSAYTDANMLAASAGHCPDVFEDEGADHVHIGVM